MRKKVVLGVVVGCCLVGGMSVFAYVIPGVTQPFDPANYYSPVTISGADSAPSIFTMKDLAKGGYQVYDPIRHKKSIVEDIKSLTEMVNSATKVANDIKNLTSMSPEGILAHYLGVSEELGDAIDVWKAYNGLMSATKTMETAWSSAFTSVDDFTQGETSVSKRMSNDKDMLTALEATYKDAMATAKLAGDQEKKVEQLETALKKLESVNGELDNKQVRDQIESLKVQLAIERNLLLTNLIGIKAAHNQAELSKEATSREDTKNIGFGACDPYHLDEYHTKTYTRPEGQGFVDFK